MGTFALICGAVDAGGNYELVASGLWTCDVDETGTIVPEDHSKLKVTKNGETFIKVSYDIKPDEEHGGKDWPWGEIYFVTIP